ncbi:MAG: hypothetical protein ACOC2M_01865 [bacterium]
MLFCQIKSQNINVGNSSFGIVSRNPIVNEDKTKGEKIDAPNDYLIKKSKIFVKKLIFSPEYKNFSEGEIIQLKEIGRLETLDSKFDNIFQKITHTLNTMFEKRRVEYAFGIGFKPPSRYFVPSPYDRDKRVGRVGYYSDYEGGYAGFQSLGTNMKKVETAESFNYVFKKEKTAQLNLYIYTYEMHTDLLELAGHTENMLDCVVLASVDLPITSKQMGFEITIHSSEEGFNLSYNQLEDFKNNPLEGTVFENFFK